MSRTWTADTCWQKARELVIARDLTCRRCHREGSDVHHIFRRSIHALRYHPVNLILLCRFCHRWAHDYKTLFRAWVEGQINGEEGGWEALQAMSRWEWKDKKSREWFQDFHPRAEAIIKRFS